jgi:hypothetical protein
MASWGEGAASLHPLDPGAAHCELALRVAEGSLATAPESVHLLVGSFNLYPFSLANQEALVEVDVTAVVEQGEAWIQEHFARSRSMTLEEASSWLHRWLLDPLGRLVARLANTMSRLIARRKRHQPSSRDSFSLRTLYRGLADAEGRHRPRDR